VGCSDLLLLLEEKEETISVYFILSALNKFDSKKGIGGADYYLVIDAVGVVAIVALPKNDFT
jgi:hypothetical protein